MTIGRASPDTPAVTTGRASPDTPAVTTEQLRTWYDERAASERVTACVRGSFGTLPGAVRFLARYAGWNGVFGSAVAGLSSKIGRSRSLFHEEGFPRPLSDRSVLLASWFFDAARDEFDDSDTAYRDTHRCLAQATLAGMIEHAAEHGHPELRDRERVERELEEPAWLEAMRDRVAAGYGHGRPDDRPAIFHAIGFHLGSEMLANEEFTAIDLELRAQHPALVESLSSRTVTLAGQAHPCYQWIRIHSGYGRAAEADHFAWALRGVHAAFRYSPPAEHADLVAQVRSGYLAFAKDHEEFFRLARD
jgi:hypothetical protein